MRTSAATICACKLNLCCVYVAMKKVYLISHLIIFQCNSCNEYFLELRDLVNPLIFYFFLIHLEDKINKETVKRWSTHRRNLRECRIRNKVTKHIVQEYGRREEGRTWYIVHNTQLHIKQTLLGFLTSFLFSVLCPQLYGHPVTFSGQTSASWFCTRHARMTTNGLMKAMVQMPCNQVSVLTTIEQIILNLNTSLCNIHHQSFNNLELSHYCHQTALDYPLASDYLFI